MSCGRLFIVAMEMSLARSHRLATLSPPPDEIPFLRITPSSDVHVGAYNAVMVVN